MSVRTTVAIEDDVLEAARKLAAAQNRPLGQVVSELMRRGLTARTTYPSASGFPTFEVREDSPPITLEDVKHGEDEPS